MVLPVTLNATLNVDLLSGLVLERERSAHAPTLSPWFAQSTTAQTLIQECQLPIGYMEETVRARRAMRELINMSLLKKNLLKVLFVTVRY